MAKRYYCLGSPICRIELPNFPKFFSTVALHEISFAKMQATFEASNMLILCKNLEDAKALRKANIVLNTPDITTAFFHPNLPIGYPLLDHVIFEIMIENDANELFKELRTIANEELETLVNRDIYFNAFYHHDRSAIPDIHIWPINKAKFTIRLLCCHYSSLVDEIDKSPRSVAYTCR